VKITKTQLSEIIEKNIQKVLREQANPMDEHEWVDSFLSGLDGLNRFLRRAYNDGYLNSIETHQELIQGLRNLQVLIKQLEEKNKDGFKS
jgi:CRISPR/Cas system-associated exonuclease Cas4 (RecB family)